MLCLVSSNEFTLLIRHAGCLLVMLMTCQQKASNRFYHFLFPTWRSNQYWNISGRSVKLVWVQVPRLTSFHPQWIRLAKVSQSPLDIIWKVWIIATANRCMFIKKQTAVLENYYSTKNVHLLKCCGAKCKINQENVAEMTRLWGDKIDYF